MAEYFQEIRHELAEAPNTLRMARYLIDIGLFEDNFTGDWPRPREYAESWQWQDRRNEPKEPEPATEEAIKSLPTFAIQTEDKDCSICLMDFELNEMVKAMPCQHMFHELCIMTWLNQNNTCPFCRHRLPTHEEEEDDDEDDRDHDLDHEDADQNRDNNSIPIAIPIPIPVPVPVIDEPEEDWETM